MSSIKQRWNIVAGKPYTKDGEQKKQWIRCGRAVQWDDGNIQIEIDAMPCFAGFDGKMSLFAEDDSKRQAPSQSRGQGRQAPPVDDFEQDSSIPF